MVSSVGSEDAATSVEGAASAVVVMSSLASLALLHADRSRAAGIKTPRGPDSGALHDGFLSRWGYSQATPSPSLSRSRLLPELSV